MKVKYYFEYLIYAGCWLAVNKGYCSILERGDQGMICGNSK